MVDTDSAVMASKNRAIGVPEKTPPNFVHPQEMVTISIHNSESTWKYLVYKEFACYYSPMLDRAFNGSFAEAETQTIDINFDYPYLFGIIQNWMYTQKIEDGSGGSMATPTFYPLWVLAGYLMMPKLQNSIASELLSVEQKGVPLDLATWIYKNTGPESKLRKLFVNVVTWDLNGKCAMESWKNCDFPPEFLLDVIMVYKDSVLASSFCGLCRRGAECIGRGGHSVGEFLEKEKFMVQEDCS